MATQVAMVGYARRGGWLGREAYPAIGPDAGDEKQAGAKEAAIRGAKTPTGSASITIL